MTNKINLYVNSSNKKTDETTTNLNVLYRADYYHLMEKIILPCQ